MPISFNTIPAVTRVPFTYVEFDGSRSESGPAQQEYQILIIGEKSESGAQALFHPVRVFSGAQAKEYFGEGSMLHRMLKRALEANSSTPLYAIAAAKEGDDLQIERVFDALKDEQYHILAYPDSTPENLKKLEDELAKRFKPDRSIEGFAFTATSKNYTETTTLLQGKNSPHVSVLCTHGSSTPPEEWAASLAAVVAFHGNIDPARPFRTLELPGIEAPKETDRFRFEEREGLLKEGGSTYVVDRAGRVRIEKLVSTYKFNEGGEPSESYSSVNTLLTLSYLRFSFRNYFASKYPRHKLATDTLHLGAGQAVMTPSLAKAECISLFRQWEDQGLVQNIDRFKNDLRVEINAKNKSRLDFNLSPQLVNQLSVLGAKIAFLF